jgi:hypothetical protein
MVYEVPASNASQKQNRFEFRVPGKRKVYDLPKVEFLRPALLKEIRDLAATIGDAEPNAEQSMALFDCQVAIFEHYVPGFLELFDDQEQIADLVTAWQNESNVTLGESSASAES